MLIALIMQVAAGGAPAATATVGAPAPTPAPANAAASAVDPNKKICKVEYETGTRLGGYRICMSKADWDAKAQAAGDATANWQHQSMDQTPR